MHFLAMIQMYSDSAEIWYPMVFEGSESKNNIKILFGTFFDQKT